MDLITQPVEPTHYTLHGFHRASGSWVSLADFDTEFEAQQAVKACHSKAQPAPEKVSIVWDDFSAFKHEAMYTIRYVLDRPDYQGRWKSR